MARVEADKRNEEQMMGARPVELSSAAAPSQVSPALSACLHAIHRHMTYCCKYSCSQACHICGVLACMPKHLTQTAADTLGCVMGS